MVASHNRYLRPKVPVYGHNRFFMPYIFFSIQTMRTGNDAIHDIAFQHIKIFPLPVTDSHCITDHGLIPLSVELHLNIFYQTGEKGVI